PADAIDGAADLRDALALLMTAAVARAAADAAIVHEIGDDGAIAVAVHGADSVDPSTIRTPLDDAAMIAASSGATVGAEPSPGPAGSAILARLGALGFAVDAALMIPIRAHGRLFGTIEIGRGTPFRAAEIASLEALVDALGAKLAGWSG